MVGNSYEKSVHQLVGFARFVNNSRRGCGIRIRNHVEISYHGQKSSGDLARDAPSSGIFGRNGTGRRWMRSFMVGVALWVGVAGSIQGGFVRRRRHHGVNEYLVSTFRRTTLPVELNLNFMRAWTLYYSMFIKGDIN